MPTLDQSKETIVIGINSLTATVHAAYSNHVQLFFRLGRNYAQYNFIFVNPPRMSIDRMRNLTASVALQVKAKYLIFIDDDVLVPFDFLEKLEKLVADGNDICCGNVIIRGYPFDYMMFRWASDKMNLNSLKEIKKDSIEQLDAVGFSCALITGSLLQKLSKPLFITTHNMTEDIWFCLKVRQEFPETKIACDTSIVCGHILWNEIISSDNRDNYTEYMERQFGLKKPTEHQTETDRGDKYLNGLMSQIGETNA